jgi:hypothetical protein
MERRSIALEALHSFEEQLAKGEVPENLPAFVKNLSRKDGVKKGVAGITQKYGIAGASYYSMWGLDDREI